MNPRARPWIGVGVAVALVGWALMSTGSPAPHSGGDNAGYVALADALLEGEGYVEPWDPASPPHTKYPPVFAASLAVAMGLGVTTWAGLKAVPLLFAVLAGAGTWVWVWRRRGPVWASAVTILTGLSASFLYHAHILLSDIPFLALTVGVFAWMERDRRRADGREDGSDGLGGDAASAAGDPAVKGWPVAAALLLTTLAVMTRTAGAPLAAAVVGAWLVRTRWREAGVSGAVLALPMLAWWLRGRGITGEGDYLREFWMVNPYRPELGEIAWTGLVPRAVENGVGYVTAHLPAALVGSSSAVWWTGLAVTVLAAIGWVRAIRDGPGVAELFVPLYAGLILVWPVVWSGDRFVLPLLPIVILHAGEGVSYLVGRLRESAVTPALAVGTAALALLQSGAVLQAADQAAACRGAVRAGGPWACSGQGMVQFTEAARWAGANLPEGSAVLTRKPRIWYAMSGVPTRTYPFVPDPDTLLAAAERAGARYVLLDLVGAQAQLVATAIGANPGAFCSVASFGSRDGPRTELLGILPAAERTDTPPGTAPTIGSCPASMHGGSEVLDDYRSSSPIPILVSSSVP